MQALVTLDSYFTLIRYSADSGASVSPPPPPLAHEFEMTAYPNPFNAMTTISFSLPKAGRVKVEVFDVMGRKVQALAYEIQQAGDHRVVFDGTGLASGIYFARVTTRGQTATRKLLLVK